MSVNYSNNRIVVSNSLDYLEKFYFNTFDDVMHKISKCDSRSYIIVNKNGIKICSDKVRLLYIHLDLIEEFLDKSGLKNYIFCDHVTEYNQWIAGMNDYLTIKIKDEYCNEECIKNLYTLFKLKGFKI